jgi:hypothetical protein
MVSAGHFIVAQKHVYSPLAGKSLGALCVSLLAGGRLAGACFNSLKRPLSEILKLWSFNLTCQASRENLTGLDLFTYHGKG